jgi:hypothetical protein
MRRRAIGVVCGCRSACIDESVDRSGGGDSRGATADCVIFGDDFAIELVRKGIEFGVAPPVTEPPSPESGHLGRARGRSGCAAPVPPRIGSDVEIHEMDVVSIDDDWRDLNLEVRRMTVADPCPEAIRAWRALDATRQSKALSRRDKSGPERRANHGHRGPGAIVLACSTASGRHNRLACVGTHGRRTHGPS